MQEKIEWLGSEKIQKISHQEKYDPNFNDVNTYRSEY